MKKAHGLDVEARERTPLSKNIKHSRFFISYLKREEIKQLRNRLKKYNHGRINVTFQLDYKR